MELEKIEQVWSVTIWYRPTQKEADAVRLYEKDVDGVIIVDNSNIDNSALCIGINNCIYIPNLANIGIAAALNIGCKKAVEKGAKWVLTMDQDSLWNQFSVKQYIDEANLYEQINKVGIFSPYHDCDGKPEKHHRYGRYEEKNCLMCSGNLLRIDAWIQTEGFREDFFIDLVDDEINCHLHRLGWKIIRINNIYLTHRLGNGVKYLGPTHHLYTLHPAWRYYYIGRNLQRMMRLYPEMNLYYQHYAWKEFKRLCLYDWDNKIDKLTQYVKGWLSEKKILYRLQSGKNSKFLYYLKAYIRQLIPNWLCKQWGEKQLRKVQYRIDYDYIKQRIDYYCQLTDIAQLSPNASLLSEWKIPHKQKVYYFDSQRITRYFNQNLRWLILPGDITIVPEYPSIVKSRPLGKDNVNSVLFKLNIVRHYIFVQDNLSFPEKRPMAIFRGKVAHKKERIEFMKMYFGSKICNCGDVSRNQELPTAWQTAKLTIREHLQYRYIIAIEGNDVASNLKWVMSSNSIAVMPRPTCETWFMEGTLLPNYHYIEIKPDFSDLEERITYYNNHINEAEAIICHAHDYVEQFKDDKRENLILMGVMNKYLQLVNANNH